MSLANHISHTLSQFSNGEIKHILCDSTGKGFLKACAWFLEDFISCIFSLCWFCFVLCWCNKSNPWVGLYSESSEYFYWITNLRGVGTLSTEGNHRSKQLLSLCNLPVFDTNLSRRPRKRVTAKKQIIASTQDWRDKNLGSPNQPALERTNPNKAGRLREVNLTVGWIPPRVLAELLDCSEQKSLKEGAGQKPAESQSKGIF